MGKLLVILFLGIAAANALAEANRQPPLLIDPAPPSPASK